MKENENVSHIVDEWWREFQDTRTPSASPPDGEEAGHADEGPELDAYTKWVLFEDDPESAEETAAHERYLREQSGVDHYSDGVYDLD